MADSNSNVIHSDPEILGEHWFLLALGFQFPPFLIICKQEIP